MEPTPMQPRAVTASSLDSFKGAKMLEAVCSIVAIYIMFYPFLSATDCSEQRL